jgi:hypothetical protein
MSLKIESANALVPDRIYARLLALAHGRSDEEARAALSALVFLLINHIGDESAIDEAFSIIEHLPMSPPQHAASI